MKKQESKKEGTKALFGDWRDEMLKSFLELLEDGRDAVGCAYTYLPGSSLNLQWYYNATATPTQEEPSDE